MGAIVNGGTAYTNLINGQGDAIATANSSTNAISNYSFDAYGNKTSGSTTATPFSYRNQYSDSETGLFYVVSRYYDPTTGSFTQEDTYWGDVKSPASLNVQQLRCFSHWKLFAILLGAEYIYSNLSQTPWKLKVTAPGIV
jgi:RHS repeat-associated protein